MLSAEVDNILQDLHNSHPRRPRGSQSGREKRRNESFQYSEQIRWFLVGTGERAPGYRLSPNYFQKFKRMSAPDWAQNMPCIIVTTMLTSYVFYNPLLRTL